MKKTPVPKAPKPRPARPAVPDAEIPRPQVLPGFMRKRYR